MHYRKDKNGNDLSILGFGCMRFPQKAGIIDYKNTKKQILMAIEGGVNYFDTAYIYPGSEATLGQILEESGLRQKVHIATKLPHYLIKSKEAMEKLFREELKRLRTDYVDFYLMHMLTDVDTWQRLLDLGIGDWLAEKKAAGQIRQVGFSYHGNSNMFCRLVDIYDWDFCQIQYNYMDEHTQAGRRGLLYANQKGLPVVIMEPLRGGKLVNRLPEEAQKLFKDHSYDYTPAQWALRWLWDQEQVTVVLSGMNSEAMVQENMTTASNVQVGALTADDQAFLKKVVKAIQGKQKVGCTGCGYCSTCPKGVDIPGSFAAYNRRFQEGKFWGLVDYFMCTCLRPNATDASQCVGCGLCEKHCPQGLPIRQHLKDVRKEFEVPVFKLGKKIAKLFKF